MESRLLIKLLMSLVSEDLYLRDEMIATYCLLMLSYYCRVHVETRRLCTKYGLTHLVMRILKMAPELFWRNAPKRYNFEEIERVKAKFPVAETTGANIDHPDITD